MEEMHELISLFCIEEENIEHFSLEVRTILRNLLEEISNKEIEEDFNFNFIILVKFISKDNNIFLLTNTDKKEIKTKISEAINNHFSIAKNRIRKIDGFNIIKRFKFPKKQNYRINYDIHDTNINKAESILSKINKERISIVLYKKGDSKRFERTLKKRFPEKRLLSINIYLDCKSTVGLLTKKEFGHIIINKQLDNNKDCYSNLIEDLIYNSEKSAYSNDISYKSLSKIMSSNEESFGKNIDSDQYLADKKFYYIKKYEQGSKIDFVDEAGIKLWVETYLYPPLISFSYGENEGVHDFIDRMQVGIKEYLPFVKFYKDKQDDHAFNDLNDVINYIYDGNIRIAIINKKYLTSIHAMREMYIFYENHTKQENDFWLIPFLMDDEKEVRQIIFERKNIDKILDQLDLDIEKHHKTKENNLKVLKKNYIPMLNFIAKTYNHLTKDEHEKNNFRVLSWAIYKHLFLSKKSSRLGIYGNVENIKQFPKISDSK